MAWLQSQDIKNGVIQARHIDASTVWDFTSVGVKADVIAESTAAAGVTVDGLLLKDGFLVALDNQGVKLGTGTDDTLAHDGTKTLWTHTTGNLVVDNTSATGATIFQLGTDTSAVKFAVENNTGADIFSVTPSSASAGTTLVAGVLDLNGTLDQDAALTGAGYVADVAGTINHATANVAAINATMTQLTAVRTSGVVASIASTVTSLATDTGGVFTSLLIAHADGGGTTPTHAGIYCMSPLDALIMVDASGSGGAVVGAMTAKSPENDAEAGYFSIRVGATRYEIPFYSVT